MLPTTFYSIMEWRPKFTWFTIVLARTMINSWKTVLLQMENNNLHFYLYFSCLRTRRASPFYSEWDEWLQTCDNPIFLTQNDLHLLLSEANLMEFVVFIMCARIHMHKYKDADITRNEIKSVVKPLKCVTSIKCEKKQGIWPILNGLRREESCHKWYNNEHDSVCCRKQLVCVFLSLNFSTQNYVNCVFGKQVMHIPWKWPSLYDKSSGITQTKNQITRNCLISRFR